METVIPAFIEIGEQEQALEIRLYLREAGAQLEEKCRESFNEEMTTLIDCCGTCFQSGSEIEVEGLLNSLVSLVLMISQEKEIVIKKFVNKLVVAQAPEYSGIRIRVLNTLFRGLSESDSVQYDIYVGMVKLAAQSGLIDHIPTDLDQLKSWISKWQVSAEDVRVLYRLVHDALQDDKQSEAATQVMVELLSTYTKENASQARNDAHNCILDFVSRPNVLLMDHLLRLTPVAFLEGELIHELLSIFVTGKYKDYIKFYENNKDFVSSIGLSHEKNVHKIRILTLMSIGEEQTEISYKELSQEIGVPEDEIEDFIIQAVKTKLIGAKLDQINSKVIISSLVHRTFGMGHWQLLQDKLQAWSKNVNAFMNSLNAVASTPQR